MNSPVFLYLIVSILFFGSFHFAFSMDDGGKLPPRAERLEDDKSIKTIRRPAWELLPKEGPSANSAPIVGEEPTETKIDLELSPFFKASEPLIFLVVEYEKNEVPSFFKSAFDRLIDYLIGAANAQVRPNLKSSLFDNEKGDFRVNDPDDVIPTYLVTYANHRSMENLHLFEKLSKSFKGNPLRNLENPFPEIKTLRQANLCLIFFESAFTKAISTVEAAIQAVQLKKQDSKDSAAAAASKDWLKVLLASKDYLTKRLAWCQETRALLKTLVGAADDQRQSKIAKISNDIDGEKGPWDFSAPSNEGSSLFNDTNDLALDTPTLLDFWESNSLRVDDFFANN